MNKVSDVLGKFNRFTVQHPRFKLAIQRIMESIETTAELGEPASAMLLGEPGTGKSRVCKRVKNLLGKPQEEDRFEGRIKTIPCLYCNIQADPTTKKLAEQMLCGLGYFHSSKNNRTLLDIVITLLDTCETKLVIIDEFQTLADKGAAKTKAAMCDWVKTLLNESHIACLLSGIPTLEDIVDDNEQLSQRYPYRARLKNLTYQRNSLEIESEWTIVLAKLSSAMIELGELTDYIFLSDEYFALATYIYCAGNMRGLRFILNGAFKRALTRGDHSLTCEDFAKAADEIIFKGRIRPDINPFTTRDFELTRILNKIS
ncbi:TniB family NTP-binding protein [Pseudomonas sp. MDT1-16]